MARRPLPPPARRMIVVPAGKVLRYGYARHGRIRFAQYGGNRWDAVDEHARRIADLGNGAQPADCPFGRWDGDTFVIEDGRHRYLALVGLGYADLLVCWLEDHEPPMRMEAGEYGSARWVPS